MTTDRSSDSTVPLPGGPLILDEAEVRALLAEAGPRTPVPAEDLHLIRAAAHREWERVVAEREGWSRWRRAVQPAAIAAGLILAAAGAWWLRSPGRIASAPVLASVRQMAGDAWSEGGGLSAAAGARRRPLHPGDPLAAGVIVATAGGPSGREGSLPGRLALRLAGGTSVRLDAGSRVRLASAARLVVEAGAVYVDSGPSLRGPAVAVETSFGTVREVGTQFEVRLAGPAQPELRVRVREGTVILAHVGGTRRLAAGGELTLGRDGEVRLGSIAAAGPEWSWVESAAPTLDIEGRPLSAYLAWVARETGLRLRYEDRNLAALAPTVILHGTIAGMTPADSLDAVLPGSGLAYRLEDGTLWVTR